MRPEALLNQINESRQRCGLLTLDEIVANIMATNFVHDPFSLLISRTAKIGRDNVFYPGVTVLSQAGQPIVIGDSNTFHMQSALLAVSGQITIGNGNQFGDGGFAAQANRPGARITIGDGGRYVQGVRVFGETNLGTGSQVIGSITLDSCHLAAGLPHTAPDPDRRGAVLKGHGAARGLTVGCGEVIVGDGSFDPSRVQRQTDFHPKSKA